MKDRTRGTLDDVDGVLRHRARGRERSLCATDSTQKSFCSFFLDNSASWSGRNTAQTLPQASAKEK